jgi:hypothetical protein
VEVGLLFTSFTSVTLTKMYEQAPGLVECNSVTLLVSGDSIGPFGPVFPLVTVQCLSTGWTNTRGYLFAWTSATLRYAPAVANWNPNRPYGVQ